MNQYAPSKVRSALTPPHIKMEFTGVSRMRTEAQALGLAKDLERLYNMQGASVEVIISDSQSHRQLVWLINKLKAMGMQDLVEEIDKIGL